MKKFKQYSIVVFEPKWAMKYIESGSTPLKYGEVVLYLGNISNAQGHCCVAKHSGEVVWLVHPDDFREATEDEV